MDISIERISHLLPCEESYQAKNKRDAIWDKWDTTMNGFLSHQEIEQELLTLLDLKCSERISEVVRQSSADTKRKHHIDGKFGPNYLEKREFRVFLQNLHKHMGSLVIFERVDRNKDNVISEDELVEAASHLIKEGLSEEKKELARKLSTDMKFTFTAFEKWLESLNFYDSRQKRG